MNDTAEEIVEEVVEEVVIIDSESCSDEEADWQLAEDGNWYCVVEEYEEDLVSESVNDTEISEVVEHKQETIVQHQYSKSTPSTPEVLRNGIRNGIKNRIKKGNKSLENIKSSKLKLFSDKKSKKKDSIQVRRKIENPEKVFGVPLNFIIANQKQKGVEGEIPQIVRWTVENIRERGLELSGLFRQCGHHTKQLEKESLINQGETLENLQLNEIDVHTVAAILKSFLRGLPYPLVPRSPAFPMLVQVSALSDIQMRLLSYKAILMCLEPLRYKLLRYLLFFLNEVAKHSSKNLMSSANLSLIFAPSFFGTLDSDASVRKETIDPMAMCKESKFTAMITQELIDNVNQIFVSENPAPAVFRATECFKSDDKNHVSLIRGDTFILLKQEENEITILISGTVAHLPTRVLDNSVEKIDFDVLKTREISSLFTGKVVIGSSSRSAEMVSLLKLSKSSEILNDKQHRHRRKTLSKFTTDALRFSTPTNKRNSVVIHSQNHS